MITLLVDESYAFDFLSILMVKYKKSGNESVEKSTDECEKHIAGQLGEKLYDSIVSSDEFKALLEANEKTFDWVDLAKTDSCKASDVDKANYDRCKARNALQEKFFPKSKVSEVKFGYEAYDKETGNGILDFLAPKEIGRTRIRLGKNSDGGYVVFKEPLQSIRFYVGFGVGDDISFEKDLIKENPSIQGRIYDGTVESLPDEVKLEFCKEMVQFGSGKEYFNSYGKKFICKMDIEGEEYNLPRVGKQAFDNCEMLVIEIHFIAENQQRFIDLLSFLRECGFVCAHLHANNHCGGRCQIDGESIPETLEATFVKNQINYGISLANYPIPGLDFPCHQRYGDLPLDFIKKRQTR